MKKIILFGAFLCSSVIFAQKVTGDFSDGYVKGYYSVTKTQPKTVPVSPSWSSSAFNDTYKYADTSEKKQKIVDQAEWQQYTDGYEKGIRDGKLDLASNKEKAKKD